MDKQEKYRGYVISWQEPPMTSAEWVVNVASEDRHLQERIGKGAEVISGEPAIKQSQRQGLLLTAYWNENSNLVAILIGMGAVATFAFLFVLNFAGLPGALIARQSPTWI